MVGVAPPTRLVPQVADAASITATAITSRVRSADSAAPSPARASDRRTIARIAAAPVPRQATQIPTCINAIPVVSLRKLGNARGRSTTGVSHSSQSANRPGC